MLGWAVAQLKGTPPRAAKQFAEKIAFGWRRVPELAIKPAFSIRALEAARETSQSYPPEYERGRGRAALPGPALACGNHAGR